MQYCTILEIWDKMSFSVLFFLSFPTCLSSNSVKTTVAFLLLVACMMWNMIGMKSPCWNPPEFFHWFQDSAHLVFSYSPNTQEICFTCLRTSWMDIFTCYLGSRVPELYHGCNSLFIGYKSICQINFLSGILKEYTSFTVVLVEKLEESLRIKIKFKKFYLGWFCFFNQLVGSGL